MQDKKLYDIYPDLSSILFSPILWIFNLYMNNKIIWQEIVSTKRLFTIFIIYLLVFYSILFFYNKINAVLGTKGSANILLVVTNLIFSHNMRSLSLYQKPFFEEAKANGNIHSSTVNIVLWIVFLLLLFWGYVLLQMVIWNWEFPLRFK